MTLFRLERVGVADLSHGLLLQGRRCLGHWLLLLLLGGLGTGTSTLRVNDFVEQIVKVHFL